jgi:hypothetical protein
MVNFFPLIVFASYTVILTLFISVGILNIKDMKVRKRDKWVKKDSIAMIIRVLFYAFLIAFGSFILKFLTGKNLLIHISKSILLLPIFPVVLTGIVYGIAKKREWYELIDEEE